MTFTAFYQDIPNLVAVTFSPPTPRQAIPSERDHLIKEMLRAIAQHDVGDRPGREPRANNRRPKPQRFLMEPRKQARKRLMQAA